MRRVLIVHNEYRSPGGEDVVVAQEIELLRSMGHSVAEYRRSNREMDTMGWRETAMLGKRMVWAEDACRDLLRLVRDEKPQVAHFHNTFAMISPAAYEAVRKAGVPVVQTLHNYRLLCSRADFYRDGHVCEDCLGRSLPWPAVLHACYQGSRVKTAGVAAAYTIHRWLGTWQRQVDCYITLTEFAKQKFVAGGLPAARITVVPNCVSPDPGAHPGSERYAVYAGRFVPETRVRTLLRAWQALPAVPLKIFGGGPGEESLRQEARNLGIAQAEFLGWQPRENVLATMQRASFLVSSSEWYENFPMVIAEAFACGLPVICPKLGAMQELVEDGRTGLHFRPADSHDLAAKVQWAWMHPAEMAAMGRAARAEFEAKYTAERHYQALLQVFERALAGAEGIR